VTRHIAIIGAGIVGAACAIELLRDGNQVTIIEPGEPGGEQAASYGNGTLLNPSSVIPMSTPGIWKKVPGYLRDPLGPLTIRWRYLPRLIPWLRRFVAAGSTPEKLATIARALKPLLASRSGRGGGCRRPDHAARRALCVPGSRRVRGGGTVLAHPA
jgi:D-amino-acid dehydrogenase